MKKEHYIVIIAVLSALCASLFCKHCDKVHAKPEDKVDTVQWFDKLAISDSSMNTLIVPGINTITGDTLFNIRRLRSNHYGGPVWTKSQVCQWMQDEYALIQEDHDRILEQRADLDREEFSLIERKRDMLDWYRLFKVNFDVDCRR